MNSDGPPPRNYFPFLDDLEVSPEGDAAAGRFGQQTALVDLVPGHSHLGPPATLGLGLIRPGPL